jgi:phosphatidylinositol alpha-1,6-mannosyltransferase
MGGMQRVASKLLTELDAHRSVELSSVLLRSSWRWVHVRTVPFLARAWWQIRRRVQAGEIDIVLFSSMVTATLAVPLRGLFDRHGVTAAAIVHGLDVTTPFPPYQWLVPHVFDALDAVLPVSRATGMACRDRGLAAEKVHVVPNGVDLDRFAPLDDRAVMRNELQRTLGARASSLSSDTLLLCSVGRQVKRKGFAWFIEHVMPRLPDTVHYWLAGDGPRADHIQSTIDQCALGDRVRRLGHVSEQNLARLYRGADLFVMPNIPVEGDMEGFGVVMLEAGQCGCPVVASRLEGIRDVITEGVNGHLVPPKQPQAFADAILRYCGASERLRAASLRAANHVANTFGWKAVTERYVQTLTRVAAPQEPATESARSAAVEAPR